MNCLPSGEPGINTSEGREEGGRYVVGAESWN